MLDRDSNVWDINEEKDLLAKRQFLIIDGWHRITALMRLHNKYPEKAIEWPKVNRVTPLIYFFFHWIGLYIITTTPR